MNEHAEILETHLDAASVFGAALPSHARRCSGRALDYFNALAGRVAGALTSECKQYAAWECCGGRFHQATVSAFNEGFFVLRFRVFCESLQIAIPWELVHELSSSIRCESNSQVLFEPTETDTTAVAYVAAKILSNRGILPDTRVYLSAATAVTEQSDITRFWDLRQKEKERESALYGRIRLSEVEYPAIVILSERLAAHLELKAKAARIDGLRRERLQKLQVTWESQLRIPIGSVLALAGIHPGQVFPLQGTAKQKPYVTLTTKTEEGSEEVYFKRPLRTQKDGSLSISFQ